MTTTLNRIRAHGPCDDGWRKLLAGLGKTCPDDEPLLYSRIVEINGLDGALWACRAEPQFSREWRLFAIWCARQVRQTDAQSIVAVDVAEQHARGMATDSELAAAWNAARDAAWSARDAAWSEMNPARDAAWDAAAAAAWSAWSAARAAQTKAFLNIVNGDDP